MSSNETQKTFVQPDISFASILRHPRGGGKSDEVPKQDEYANFKGQDLQEKTLDEKFDELLCRVEWTVPKCVRQIRTDYEINKIVIFTNDDTSEEFRDFFSRAAISGDPYFCISKVTSTLADDLLVKPFKNPPGASAENKGATADAEYIFSYKKDKQIKPGSMLFKVLTEYEEKIEKTTTIKSFKDVHDKFHSSKCNVWPWSIGCSTIDKKTKDKYLLTTCHCLGVGPCTNSKLTFYSEYKCDKDLPKLDKISNQPIGKFGAWWFENQYLVVDGLLLPVQNSYLDQDHVSMTFKNPETDTDEIISMEVYLGKIEAFHERKVYKYGAYSGLTVGKIFASPSKKVVNIEDKLCQGFFAVQPLDGEGDVGFAKHGDSGSLVFGRDPNTKQFVAIGLITMKSMEPGYISVLCTPLSTISKYMMPFEGKEIEVLQPREPGASK